MVYKLMMKFNLQWLPAKLQPSGRDNGLFENVGLESDLPYHSVHCINHSGTADAGDRS